MIGKGEARRRHKVYLVLCCMLLPKVSSSKLNNIIGELSDASDVGTRVNDEG